MLAVVCRLSLGLAVIDQIIIATRFNVAVDHLGESVESAVDAAAHALGGVFD